MSYGHSVATRCDVHINTVAYPVEVPEYSTKKPDAFLDGSLDTLFIPDKHAMVMSRITIAAMIDLSYRVILFKILYADDIVEIHKTLTDYINQLSAFTGHDDVDLYLAKARHFATQIKRSVMILSRTNPKAKAIMHNDSLADLFTKNAVSGGPEV